MRIFFACNVVRDYFRVIRSQLATAETEVAHCWSMQAFIENENGKLKFRKKQQQISSL